MVDRIDISEPFTVVESGDDSNGNTLYDLEGATGQELVAQRIVRGLLTEPGELVHRPEWGAGLRSYQNEPTTTTRRQQLTHDADRFLGALSFIEDHRVEVSIGDNGAFRLDVTARSDGEKLQIPPITI